MSHTSSKTILKYLRQQRLVSVSNPHFPRHPFADRSGISQFLSRQPKIHSYTSQRPSTYQLIQFSTSASSRSPYRRIFENASQKITSSSNLLPGRSLQGFKYFSLKGADLGSKVSGDFVKNILKDPATGIKNVFLRYKEAVGLQAEAFWKRNSLVLLGAGGVMVCILLWKILFGIANTFIGFSEGMAKYGFLALSTAIVAFAGLCLRSRFTINPDKVYRIAMRKLNTSAGILEVMGAPLSGSDLRAYVMSGGGITVKSFRPKLRSKRCFLLFPIRGSERKGLVSVEVKKKEGQYDMKLLAVDIPMASGPDQRLFLVGDEEEYRIGDGLISELRDPVVKAMAATKEFEERDEKEEKEDAERELQEAERKHQEEIQKLERDGSR